MQRLSSLGPPLVMAALAATACGGPTINWIAPPASACASPGTCSGDGGDGPVCRIVFCLPGAGGPDSGANGTLEERCAAIPGIVQRCRDGTCRSVMSDLGEARAMLDELGRGLEGHAVAASGCAVSIVGHSWGGVDAVSLAGAVVERKVAPSRVALVVVLDGYVPFGDRRIEVPAGLDRVVSFRHSISSGFDCSSEVPLGPYRGLPIRCAAEASCAEFDLSVSGDAIDHCGLVSDVFPDVLRLLDGTPPAELGRDDAVEVQRR